MAPRAFRVQLGLIKTWLDREAANRAQAGNLRTRRGSLSAKTIPNANQDQKSPSAQTDFGIHNAGNARVRMVAMCQRPQRVYAVGSFQDEVQQVSCKFCASGTFTNTTGQTTCQPHQAVCEAGSEISTSANRFRDLQCELCRPGRFSDQSNQQSCTACRGTDYQDEAGQTSCKDFILGRTVCPPGTRSNGRSCVPCGRGFHQPNSRQTTCIACPTGKFANMIGQAICQDHTQCLPGTQQIGRPSRFRNTVCRKCSGKITRTW